MFVDKVSHAFDKGLVEKVVLSLNLFPNNWNLITSLVSKETCTEAARADSR